MRCISSSCVVKCHGDFCILGMNYIWHVNQIIIIIIHFGLVGTEHTYAARKGLMLKERFLKGWGGFNCIVIVVD